ncbi:MAG: bifunctional riboflavin kinase/FAD synthetase [Chloroflexi bacterium]|nr:bifunctional riboflavin kinase/FAD synthetase [Chloroflexota bacterium]
MLLEEELARFKPDKDTVLTIGVFDGVHLGHQRLISELTGQARQRGMLSAVVTFRQHPQQVLGQEALPFLTDTVTREELLTEEGVDIIAMLSFTEELSHLDARQFMCLLQKHLRMRALVVGPDSALGRHREGDIDALHRLGEEMGFSLTVVPQMTLNGETVSSTAIRRALAEGDMQKVHRLYGRLFSLRGKVVAGAGRGAGLGFPTANLQIEPSQALPPDGVYASWAYVGGKRYPSMTNVGTCPTFGPCDRTVEVYIIGYQEDIYGRELKIELVERVRDEKKFDTVDELKKQMAEDVRLGEAILGSAHDH